MRSPRYLAVEGCVCEGLCPAWTDSCSDPHCGVMSQGHADEFTRKDVEPDCVLGFVPGAGYSKKAGPQPV